MQSIKSKILRGGWLSEVLSYKNKHFLRWRWRCRAISSAWKIYQQGPSGNEVVTIVQPKCLPGIHWASPSRRFESTFAKPLLQAKVWSEYSVFFTTNCGVTTLHSNLKNLHFQIHRQFVAENYTGIKQANPNLPFLVREANGVQPRIFARFGMLIAAFIPFPKPFLSYLSSRWL